MWRAVKLIVDFLEIYLPVAIFIVLVGSVFVQVLFRYVLDDPVAQLFEVSIYSFIWVIYLGGALATRFNQHMRFDLIYRRLPANGRLMIDVGFDALLNVIIAVIIWPTVQNTIQLYQVKSSTLQIPWTYLLICFPVFLALVFLHNTLSVVYKIREIAGKGARPEETQPWL